MVAVEGAAGFGAEVLFVRFEEPGRCENIRGNVRLEGCRDVKLVEKSPDTIVFVGATSAEWHLVGKRKHEVGHAGEVVGGGEVHIAHNDDVGGRRGGKDRVDTGLEDGLGDSAFPCRLGSAAQLRGEVADKEVESIESGRGGNKSRIRQVLNIVSTRVGNMQGMVNSRISSIRGAVHTRIIKVGSGGVGSIGKERVAIGKNGALDVEDVAGGGGRYRHGDGFAVEKVEAGIVIQQGDIYAAFVGAFVMDVLVMITA